MPENDFSEDGGDFELSPLDSGEEFGVVSSDDTTLNIYGLDNDDVDIVIENMRILFDQAAAYVSACTARPRNAKTAQEAASMATACLEEIRVDLFMKTGDEEAALRVDRPAVVTMLAKLVDRALSTGADAKYVADRLFMFAIGGPQHDQSFLETIPADALQAMNACNWAFLDLLYESLTGEPLALPA